MTAQAEKKSGNFIITRQIFVDPPTKAPPKDDDSSSAYDSGDDLSDGISSGGHETSDDEAAARYCGLDFTREKALVDFESYVQDDLQLFLDNKGVELYDQTNNSPPESIIYLGKQRIFYQKTFGEENLMCLTLMDFIASLTGKPANEDDILHIMQQNIFQWLRKNQSVDGGYINWCIIVYGGNSYFLWIFC